MHKDYMLIRLNKYLSDNGICSRREADEHILAGEVFINDEKSELGAKIDPDTDVVKFNNEEIKTTSKRVYYALYKPKGVITSSSDEMGRKTVLDLVPSKPRVYPVGRLDADSEGLIILTNDGDLAQNLTHPSYKHEKEYEVTTRIKNHESRIKETVAENIKESFTKGLNIDGKSMKVDSISVALIPNSKFLILRLTLHTGYNRQIRKMCAKIGLEVKRLARVRIGRLRLSELGLKPSEYKVIKKEDIF